MKHLKRTMILLLAAVMMTAFAACSSSPASTTSTASSASSAQESGEESTPSDNSGVAEGTAIQITDSFSISDPEGLDYDTRYVYQGSTGSTLINNMQMSGYNAQAMYEILYAKDGQAVGEYQVIVAADEAAATSLLDFYQSHGQTLTQEGNVIYVYSDTDMIQAMVATYSGMGMFSGTSAQDYLDWFASYNGLVEYQP